MRIACPTCNTSYEVPETALKPGRNVRCARCETQWAALTSPSLAPSPTREELEHLYAPGDEEEPADDLPVRSAMERLSAHRKQRQGGKALAAAWALTAVVLIGLVAAGVAGRRAVMVAWPPTMRLYGLIGLSGASTEVPEAPHADPKG